MVVQIIRIQMGNSNDFIVAAPHTLCGFQTDFVRFLRRDLAHLKALMPVTRYIAACFPVPPLGCHHMLISSLGRTVNGGYIHLLSGFAIILNIAECRPQIFVQELFIGGFVGIVRIVDNFFQPVFDRPGPHIGKRAEHSLTRGSKIH